MRGDGLRPEAFPEDLWDYVDPVLKYFVESCIQKTVQELDIYDKTGKFRPSWLQMECEPILKETTALNSLAHSSQIVTTRQNYYNYNHTILYTLNYL